MLEELVTMDMFYTGTSIIITLGAFLLLIAYAINKAKLDGPQQTIRRHRRILVPTRHSARYLLMAHNHRHSRR